MKKIALFLFLMVALPLMAAQLSEVIDSPHRAEKNSSRDQFRHPLETLEFFRVQAGLSVVEIWPGGGWYTEILAPYLKGEGSFIAAHFPRDTPIAYFNTVRAGFEQMLADAPEQYSAVKLAEFNPGTRTLTVPDNSADRVLTFRNVHNWLRSDSEKEAFALFYRALKPGGLLGVVEHRSKSDVDRQWMLENGYMTEAYVIALAEQAGFKLLEKSEINANPKDSANHPKGVWTLPPTLRLGDENREGYVAIGESDRMTLLFVKVH